MTREETKQLLLVISSAFPNFKAQDKTLLIDSWHMFLEEYDYNTIKIALKTYMATANSGFAPSVSQLIGMKHLGDMMQELTEGEVAAMVHKAISNSTYNSQSEFEKLPAAVQRAVGSSEQLKAWAMTENLNNEVVASNVMRSYKSIMQKNKEYARLPQEAKEIAQLATSVLEILPEGK